jgi:hypothetical protein
MASGDVKFAVTYRGYNELRTKLRTSDEWVGEPYRRSFQAMGQIGAESVQAGAPIGSTGRTVNEVRPVVSKAKIPRFVRIEERAMNRGMAYPRILEFSPWAQNRYRKGRNRHRLWMKKAIQRVVPVYERLLEMAGDAVEQAWAQ